MRRNTKKRAHAAFPMLGERSYNPAELQSCERDFIAGDKLALAHAVAICACADLVLPEWVARAFLQGFNELREFKVKSWDDVLGQPRPKGTHARALRKRRERSFLAWAHVRHLAASGTPIDNEMFEAVGKRLHVGRELAKRFYVYEEKRIQNAVPLLPDTTNEALSQLTDAAVKALESAAHADSAQERGAARARLRGVQGRIHAFFTRRPPQR